MKQLTAKDNPAFAHMTATAANVWAVISVLKLARLLGMRFIFAVLAQYLFRDIEQAIGQLSDANNEQTGLIKKLGKDIAIGAKLKTLFGGVKTRDMKTIASYDKSESGYVTRWIKANQADLMRIDWKEFEKRVKAGSVGDDCPVKFETESSVSVNYEDVIKFSGLPTPRMAIEIADETAEADMELSETAIVYADTNPEPAPIQVKPGELSHIEQAAENVAAVVRLSGSSIDEIGNALDPPPVPIEAAPQATGEPHIDSLDETPVEMTADEFKSTIKKLDAIVDKHAEVTDEQLQSWVDKYAKQTKSDDEFPDDIPF